MRQLQPHPYAELIPAMDSEQLTALVCDIRERGQIDPIVLFDGLILDGRHRYKACEVLGIEPRTKSFEGSEEDALFFVISKNLHRRHLNESQRSMIGSRLAAMKPGRPENKPANLPVYSQAKAAEQLGVSERSVRTARKVQEQCTPELVAMVDAGKVSVSAAATLVDESAETQRAVVEQVQSGKARTVKQATQQVRELSGEEYSQDSPTSPVENDIDVTFDEDDADDVNADDLGLDEDDVDDAEDLPAARLTTSQLLTSSNSNEWYSPECIVEPARIVLGGRIDLDPASCPDANAVIQAETIYTKEQDGLSLPWHGRIWCNPPYERGFMDRFAQVIDGRWSHFDSMMLLTNNCTDAAWWQFLAERAHQICFLRGRLKFWGPNETGNGAAQGQTIMLFSDTWQVEQAFSKDLNSMGWIGA